MRPQHEILLYTLPISQYAHKQKAATVLNKTKQNYLVQNCLYQELNHGKTKAF